MFRYVQELNLFLTPLRMVWIYTYVAFNHSYTTICEKKDGKLILLEVLPEISVSSIQQFFSKMDVDAIWEVTIDCNSVVYDAVKQIFPDRKIGVDTDALKYVVKKNMMTLYMKLQRIIRNL